MDKLAYSVAEAARQVGISRTRMYEIYNSGDIAFTRIGGRVVVLATELQRWLSDQPTTRGNE